MPSEPLPLLLTHREYDPELYQSRAPARTFFLLKPDAVQRGLVGAILRKIEQAGFRLERQERLRPARADFHALYRDHQDLPHFEDLLDFMTSGPSIAGVLSHDAGDTVDRLRKLIGPFRAPREPMTIRWEFMDPDAPGYQNLIHASDSASAASAEALLFLKGGLSL
jgi:nucleoside-diphosphate kinase